MGKMGNSPDVKDSRRPHHASAPHGPSPRGRHYTFVMRDNRMAERTNSGSRPIKVGVVADQTGPLSFVGVANANVARMVIGDIIA
jgi:hypothetical protein